MKSDIEIAQAAVMEPIANVVAPYGVTADDIEQYGKYKAKLSEELLASLSEQPDGKLVLVTAINPTPAGEGKTTTSIGLGQAFGKLGKKAILALREPSLGPCFGIKGGAAGGGGRGGSIRRRDGCFGASEKEEFWGFLLLLFSSRRREKVREGERKRGGDVLELDALIVTLHLVWSGPAVLYIFFFYF